jgi:hypothetical protein
VFDWYGPPRAVLANVRIVLTPEDRRFELVVNDNVKVSNRDIVGKSRTDDVARCHSVSSWEKSSKPNSKDAFSDDSWLSVDRLADILLKSRSIRPH